MARRSAGGARTRSAVVLLAVVSWLVPAAGAAAQALPDVVGQGIATAEAAVRAWDPEATILRTWAAPPGTAGDDVLVVLRQTPDLLKDPPVVALHVGVRVPDVRSLTVAEAYERLVAHGLEPSPASEPAQPWWLVADQAPRAGWVLELGRSVRLTLEIPPPPGTTWAPNIVGQTLDEAARLAEDAGLVLEVDAVGTGEVPGTVVKQDPPAETLVDLGAPIVGTVELRPALVEVPDVVGRSESAAVDAIDAAGLVPEISVRGDGSRRGPVSAQRPPAGWLVRKGAVVAVVVPLVADDPTITVPDIVGMTIADAEAALGTSGLALAVEPLGDGEPGLVVRQDPPAGTSVDAGTTVVAFVDPAAPPEVRTDPPTAGPEEQPTDVGDATVLVPDIVGLTVAAAEDELAAAGLALRLDVSGTGDDIGPVLDQEPPPGARLPAGAAVVARIERTAAGAVTGAGGLPLAALLVGALLAGVALGATGVRRLRTRRDRRWVDEHVTANPRPDLTPELTAVEERGRPSRTVGLVVSADEPEHTFEETPL